MRLLVQALIQVLKAIFLCFSAICIILTPLLHAFFFLLLTRPEQPILCQVAGGFFFPGYLVAGIYVAVGVVLALLLLGSFRILYGSTVGEGLKIFF